MKLTGLWSTRLPLELYNKVPFPLKVLERHNRTSFALHGLASGALPLQEGGGVGLGPSTSPQTDRRVQSNLFGRLSMARHFHPRASEALDWPPEAANPEARATTIGS